MSTRPPRRRSPSDDLIAPPRPRRELPFAFVLDELASLEPWTRAMFGATAVYVDDRIVMILRDKASKDDDDGVWIATRSEHRASLRAELPSLRSLTIFGDGETGWQILPAAAATFEDDVLRACALVLRGDPRVGKVPMVRLSTRAPAKKKAARKRR